LCPRPGHQLNLRPHEVCCPDIRSTNNRRLNELIGFLLCVSALLLFLSLASYSPLDPSSNSRSVLTGSGTARNWIGVVGAITSDLFLQFFGIGAFLAPVVIGVLGTRWFRSRRIQSPFAKSLGAIWLLVFVPALLALLPGTCAGWRDTDRGTCGSGRGRRFDSLPESGRRLYRLYHGACRVPVSLDRVLVLIAPAVGAHAFCIHPGTLGPVEGLASESGAQESTKGT